MEPVPPAGTRIRNAFNGETFIFTHIDEGANEFQCDVFIEFGGMKTGTGRQHIHPDADEEFIVKEGKLKLMVDGKWRELVAGERCLVHRGVPIFFAMVTTARRCSPPDSRRPDSFSASFSTCLSAPQTIPNGTMKGVSLLRCLGHSRFTLSPDTATGPEYRYGFKKCCLPR
jgi:quercetin dioxygenase-like cupin family protein